MNLMPPPALTGNMEQDVKALSEWTIEVHRFLQYPGGDTTWETVVSPPLHRAKFTWKDADEIYLGVGMYRHMGTKTQNVYWDSQLTFQFGSGGSNADSEDLAVSDWFYVYLDDSAIVTAETNVITESELLAVTEEPVWSASKYGWYGSAAAGNATANDKCIFAARTHTDSTVLEFLHEDDLCLFADDIVVSSGLDPDTTWTDSTQVIPKFTRKAQVTFYIAGTDDRLLTWRTNGQIASAGHNALRLNSNTARGMNTLPVITDANGIIEVRFNSATDNTVSVYTNGWYFPKGM